MEPLPEDRIRSRLSDDLPEWRLDGDAIHRRYEFDSFHDAIAFINRIAAKAEAADHHPDLRNQYRTVEVALSTHSVGGVTQKDLALALEIDGLAQTTPD